MDDVLAARSGGGGHGVTLAELCEQATVPVGEGYHTWPPPWGKQSVTLEDGWFLYGLVRALKPALIVESGTGLGVAAMFLATALKDNGSGRLLTFEPDQPFARQAAELLDGLPAEAVHGDFVGRRLRPELVFIDSHGGRRGSDLAYWLDGSYRGLVCLHDANREYDKYGAEGVLIPGSDGLWLGRARPGGKARS